MRALAERADLILARQEKGESLWQLGRKEEAISVWSDAVQRSPQLALANNQLSGAERTFARFQEASAHENQADQFTPDNPFYHWVIGLRLQDLGMTELAEKHFQRAIQLTGPSWLAGFQAAESGLKLTFDWHCFRKLFRMIVDCDRHRDATYPHRGAGDVFRYRLRWRHVEHRISALHRDSSHTPR